MNIYFISVLFIYLSAMSSPSSFEEIDVVKLNGDVYIYHSYAMYEGERVPANGMILESSDEVILIDTPWDNQQTIQLLEWVDWELDKPVSFTVITHAHSDRIGGIDVLKSRNIPAISTHLTAKEAVKNSYLQPDKTFQSDTLLTYGNSSLEVYYPGPGHTTDNSVVYVNDHNILFGGCFIKNSSSYSLGNIEDASVKNWSNSLRRVMERYPERNVVIPGHGNWKPGAIENTLDLLSKIETD